MKMQLSSKNKERSKILVRLENNCQKSAWRITYNCSRLWVEKWPSDTVLVHSGYYRIPQTRWHVNSRHWFSQFWKLKVWDQGTSKAGEGFCLGLLWTPFLHCVLTCKKEQAALWDLFYRSNNPIREGATIMTSSPSKGSISKYHHIYGLRFQNMNSGETQTFRLEQRLVAKELNWQHGR